MEMSLFAVHTEFEGMSEFTREEHYAQFSAHSLVPNQWIKSGNGLWFSMHRGLLDLDQVPLVPCCLVLRRF